MRLKDSDHREIINSIRSGDTKVRDKYLLLYYSRIKKNLVKLRIPEEYHEDITHDCIVMLIRLILEADLDKQKSICKFLHIQIINQIAKSLGIYYPYNKKINDKVYKKPSLYLRDKVGYYNGYNIIEEYLSGSEVDEEIMFDQGTSFRETEDLVIDKQIRDDYHSYLESQSSIKQDIILSRLPIDDDYKEPCQKIADRHDCTRAYIALEEKNIIRRIKKNSVLTPYLKL